MLFNCSINFNIYKVISIRKKKNKKKQRIEEAKWKAFRALN